MAAIEECNLDKASCWSGSSIKGSPKTYIQLSIGVSDYSSRMPSARGILW